MRAGSWAGSGEDLDSCHGNLDRATNLASQRRDDGLEVATALALPTETATDLHGDNVHLPHRDPKDAAGVVAQSEVTLTAGPDGHSVIGVPTGGCGVGFDITLVNRFGVVLPLDDLVSLRETGLDIAQAELEVIGDVGTVAPVAFGPAAGSLRRIGQRHQPFVDQGSARSHGFVGVEYRRQHLPVHVNQRQGFFSKVGRVCDDGGHGVSEIQGFLTGHHIAGVEPVVDGGPFFLIVDLGGNIREIGAGNHGMYAG